MASIEERIIFEKLTGKTAIQCAKNVENIEKTQISGPAIATPGNVDADGHIAEIIHRIQEMEANRENRAYRHIFSCRPIIGRAIVFAKRVVRKCLKWYIEPICDQQTEFNNSATPAIGHLCELQMIWSKAINHQSDRIENIEKSSKGYESDIAWIRENQDRITQALEEIRRERESLKKAQEQAEQINAIATAFGRQLVSAQEAMQRQISEHKQHASEYESHLNEAMEQLREMRKKDAEEAARDEQVVKKSTAQSGEDMIVEYVTRVLGKKLDEMTYLDLGANHAKYLSNTYHFYQKGVRGVLVEANPALIGELKLHRSGDVILNRCISNTSGELVDFYVLNGDGLSTPSLEGAEEAIRENPAMKIEQVVSVKTITIGEIISTYFDKTPTIINLDIEGKEMDILNSMDFENQRPLIMIIETIPYRNKLVVGMKNDEIKAFMERKNYIEYAFTGINSIFLDKKQIAEVLE